MTERDNQALRFADLKLVMDTYRNVIELNTLLLEQQNQIFDLQKDTSKNQSKLLSNHIKTDERIKEIIEKIKTQDSEIKVFFDKINLEHKELGGEIHGRFDIESVKLDETKDVLKNMNLDMTKQHSGITNKLYVALVGSALIVIALLSLFTTALSKFGMLDELHLLINKIIVFLKIT